MKKMSLGKEIATVLAVAVVTGFTYNAFSPEGVPLVRVAPVKVAVDDAEIFGVPADTLSRAPLAAASPETSGQGAFRVISLDQMKRVVAERRAMVLDARTPAEYAEGHISGAENLYAVEPDTWVERIADLPRDTLLVIYCSNPHCPYGRDLAEFLGAFGFSNMLLYDDGWDGWTGAGLPASGGGKE